MSIFFHIQSKNILQSLIITSYLILQYMLIALKVISYAIIQAIDKYNFSNIATKVHNFSYIYCI
jgi:hypothetical protein